MVLKAALLGTKSSI